MQGDRTNLKGKKDQYYFKSTAVICRDSSHNVYYKGWQEGQGQVVIKQYHRRSQIKEEWKATQMLGKERKLFREQIQYQDRAYLVMKLFKNSVAGQLQSNLEALQDRPERLEKVLNSINIQKFMEDVSWQLENLLDQAKPFKLSHFDPTSIAIFEEEGRQIYSLVNFESRPKEGANTPYDDPDSTGYGYNPESSVWTFGCMLFQLLSLGSKFIQDEQFFRLTVDSDKQAYFRDRIMQLQYELWHTKTKKDYELGVIKGCLHRLKKERWEVRTLSDYIQLTHVQIGVEQLEAQSESKMKLQVVSQLAYESKRCNLMRIKIDGLFDELIPNQTDISKGLIYVLCKISLQVYFERYERAQGKVCWMRSVGKQDLDSKFVEVKGYRQMKERMDEVSCKIEDCVKREGTSKLWREMQLFCPQYKDISVIEPLNILKRICWRYQAVISKSENLLKSLIWIVELMKPNEKQKDIIQEMEKLKSSSIINTTQAIFYQWYKGKERQLQGLQRKQKSNYFEERQADLFLGKSENDQVDGL